MVIASAVNGVFVGSNPTVSAKFGSITQRDRDPPFKRSDPGAIPGGPTKILEGCPRGLWALIANQMVANAARGFDSHTFCHNVKGNIVILCPNHHTMIHRSKYADEIKTEIQRILGN